MIEKNIRKIPVNFLDTTQAEQELTLLAKEIELHDKLYYNENSPIISDADYDMLRIRNSKLEEKFSNLKLDNSPSSKIGAPPSKGFERISHAQPMLSLANAFSLQDVNNFISRIRRFLGIYEDIPVPIIGEPKIDGLSASITYKNGDLVVGATRGDGNIGENVTQNIMTISDIPKRLLGSNIPQMVEIRGEVFMKISEFHKLNQNRETDGSKVFVNTRNAASGALRQIDPEMTAKRQLNFFAYGYGKTTSPLPTYYNEFLDNLKDWGFQTNPLSKRCENIQDTKKLYDKICETRNNLDYDIDGVVYKVNNVRWQERLGAAGREPRWAIAWKFPAIQATTIVKKIIIQVGRTGTLTPVAILKPVHVGGATVTRANLHNEDEILRKDIREGDTVLIQRAGDVIPQIVSVVKEHRSNTSNKYSFPTTCPECGNAAIKLETEAARRCIGDLVCPAQVIEHLKHFVSRGALDIDGLGDKQIRAFWENGRLKKPSDIFKLEKLDKDAKIPLFQQNGWGQKSASNLFETINQSRNVTLEKFIFSLGIRHIGQATARLLSRKYQTLQTLTQAMVLSRPYKGEYWDELENIDGIGPIVARSIVDFFAQSDNYNEIQSLALELNIEPLVVINNDSPLSGKTIVFTGVLKQMTRVEAKARAESLDARVSGSISKKTDYLITGNNAGSKIQKARSLGITILDENEWMNLIL